MIFYQIWNTNYTLHFFLLGCHDNATILAGLCTHSRPSGNIKCYAKLKVFTRSGRAATSEWPRLWSFKIIKWLRATLHCVTDYYTHLLFCCKPGESSNSRPILGIYYKCWLINVKIFLLDMTVIKNQYACRLENGIWIGKKSKFHEKKAQKWTLEFFWTHFEVLRIHDYSLGPKITKCGDNLYCFLKAGKKPQKFGSPIRLCGETAYDFLVRFLSCQQFDKINY